MQIKQIKLTDKLDDVCAQMQPELWGKDNDMAVFNSADLRKFLESNGVLLLAYEGEKIVGDAMCYIMYYPSGEHHFYVHELDTHPDYRRRGVGEALMREALQVAKRLGMTEVWLGTEHDNKAAKALYQKLGPTDVDEGPTYVFDLKR
jgi:ribosomal protein S18 acetylase RimI-like enzyme